MPNHRVSPINHAQALTWRSLFEHHLTTTGKAEKPCIPSAILFGGANANEVSALLTDLLRQRGVPEACIDDRAKVVLEKLGRQQVTRAFRTMDPWRELKQLANQATPKLQIVLPSELQEAIQTKAKEGGKFGDKSKKVKPERSRRKLYTSVPWMCPSLRESSVISIGSRCSKCLLHA